MARLTAALAVTLGVAAACWVIAIRQMSGMDMAVATRLGSFAFFAGPKGRPSTCLSRSRSSRSGL